MDQQINPEKNVPQTSSSQPSESWTSEYYKAIKAGLARVWLNKYLWFWGIFIPGAGASFNFGSQGEMDEEELSGKAQEFFQEATGFLSEYIIWIALGVLVLLLMGILFWTLSAVARSGVIQALEALQNPKEGATYDFKGVWRAGKQRFLQIMLIDVVIGFSMLLIMIVLVSPIVLTFFQGKVFGGIMLALLAIVIYIPLVLLAVFLKQVGAIVTTLSKMDAVKSLEVSYFYVRGNIREVLKMLLSLVVLGVVQGIATFIVIFPFIVIVIGISLIFVGFSGGDIFSDPFGNPVLIIVVGFIALCLVVLLLVMKSIFTLWLQDLWIWWTKRVGSVFVKEADSQETVIEQSVKGEVLTGVKENRAEETIENSK
ncbi:MAG: hypothetical protein U9O20_01490 [Patescibacteria group bacterium]|nr:hypothetical protein [Patescibacteria group bacterium]